MTWTYSPSLTTARDRIRFKLGDTDQSDQLVSDEEVAGVLSVQPSESLAAAQLAEGIAGRFSRKVSFSNGALSMQAGEQAKAYLELAARLRSQASQDAIHQISILVGGRTIAGRQDLASDPSVIQPAFQLDQDDSPLVQPANNINPRTGQPQ